MNLLSSGHPQLCGGAERILSQRLRAGPGLQLLQGLKNGLRSEVLNLCCKVYTVVDEMFLAGEIRETSQTKVSSNIFLPYKGSRPNFFLGKLGILSQPA